MNDNHPQRWVKIPGPGQFRGEGTWMKLEELGASVSDYEQTKTSGFLPTHEGPEPPKDS